MKKYVRSLSVFLSAALLMASTGFAKELIDFKSNREEYTLRTLIGNEVTRNSDTGEIIFKNKTKTAWPDHTTYIIDQNTVIDPRLVTEDFLNFDAFIDGSRPIVNVYLSLEDDKDYNENYAERTVGKTLRLAAVESNRSQWISLKMEELQAIFNRLNNCKIMTYEDGSFRPNDRISRAEMAKIIAVMGGYKAGGAVSASFSDMADDHWANGYIKNCIDLGAIAGYEDGTFRPDAEVSFQETAKLLVSLLGYTPKAEEVGTYPDGYFAMAGVLGLLESSSLEVTEKETPLCRKDVAIMLDIALDVPLMVKSEKDENISYQICNGIDLPLKTLATEYFEGK